MNNRMLERLRISTERVEEIFDVPKTKELWEQITQHQNYKKMLQQMNERLETSGGKSISMEERAKHKIIESALIFCANEGSITFDEAVQKAAKKFFAQLKSVTDDEINELSDRFFLNLLISDSMKG